MFSECIFRPSVLQKNTIKNQIKLFKRHPIIYEKCYTLNKKHYAIFVQFVTRLVLINALLVANRSNYF